MKSKQRTRVHAKDDIRCLEILRDECDTDEATSDFGLDLGLKSKYPQKYRNAAKQAKRATVLKGKEKTDTTRMSEVQDSSEEADTEGEESDVVEVVDTLETSRPTGAKYRALQEDQHPASALGKEKVTVPRILETG